MRLGASVVTQSNNRASSGNVVFQHIVIHILRLRSVDLHVYIYDYMSSVYGVNVEALQICFHTQHVDPVTRQQSRKTYNRVYSKKGGSRVDHRGRQWAIYT